MFQFHAPALWLVNRSSTRKISRIITFRLPDYFRYWTLIIDFSYVKSHVSESSEFKKFKEGYRVLSYREMWGSDVVKPK